MVRDAPGARPDASCAVAGVQVAPAQIRLRTQAGSSEWRILGIRIIEAASSSAGCLPGSTKIGRSSGCLFPIMIAVPSAFQVWIGGRSRSGVSRARLYLAADVAIGSGGL